MGSWESGLLMVLLLFCLAARKPPKADAFFWLIPVSALLAFLPPGLLLPIRKELLLAAILPLVIWAYFQDWIYARWRPSWKEMLIWVVAALVSGLALKLSGGIALPAALAGGLALASLLSQELPGEGEKRSILTYFGPLLLFFILTGPENGISAHRRYLGSMFSGGFYGLLLAGLTVVASTRLTSRLRIWAAFTQVLFVYWLATATGFSAVTASLVSVGVYAELRLFRDINPELMIVPVPASSRSLQSVFLLLFILIGWQAQLPLEGGIVLLSGITLAASLVLSVTARLLRFSQPPPREVMQPVRAGILISTAIPLTSCFLPAGNSLFSAVALAGIVGLLGPTLLYSVQTYRSLLNHSGEEFEHWERINRPTWPLHRSNDDEDETYP